MPNSPEQVIAAFVQCVNARDVEGLVQLYEPDALFIPAAGQRVQGRGALGQAFLSTFALRPTVEVTPVELVSTGEIAWVSNSWTLRGTAADGTEIARSGRSSVVLRRQSDHSWRIALDRL